MATGEAPAAASAVGKESVAPVARCGRPPGVTKAVMEERRRVAAAEAPQVVKKVRKAHRSHREKELRLRGPLQAAAESRVPEDFVKDAQALVRAATRRFRERADPLGDAAYLFQLAAQEASSATTSAWLTASAPLAIQDRPPEEAAISTAAAAAPATKS